jgi:ABC-type lipoprotein release transport system permease subunit
MNARTIVLRSIRFYWRPHLGVILGAAVATMVLAGSLLVGDSVKATLLSQAKARIGKVDAVAVAGDRFFRTELAQAVGDDASSVLLLRGSAAAADGSARANHVQVLGVDDRFWRLSPAGKTPAVGEALIINEQLQKQLGANVGDTLVLRVEKPGVFSRDAPLSGEENEVVAIRAVIGAVVTDAEFGRFSLQASQVPPLSIFLSRELLESRLKFPGRANLLLAREKSAMQLRETMARAWTLEDAGLKLQKTPTGEIELRSERVFLDPQIVTAAPQGTDSLTYLVNELRAGTRATPYSMVTAIDAPSSGFLPAELAAGEIAINAWLAEDLGVREGDKVTLKYFVMGERRRLEEKVKEFTVLAIVPMSERQLNGSWMPDFPGLSDAANCRDWRPGFEMNLSAIRDKDEAYWDEYRGTPKAFINIAEGQALWKNRWGDLTSIRYPPTVDPEQIASQIARAVPPDSLGVQFIPLRETAIAATRAPVDFGELFVSFSVFLIGAAGMLTALLFVFSVDQRRDQTGLLLALGWSERRVRSLFLLEGVILAAIGSIVGVGAALGYTRLVLHALSTVWKGAVNSAEFVFAPSPASLAIGVIAGIVISAFAMWLAVRKQFRSSPRELLTGANSEPREFHSPLRNTSGATGRIRFTTMGAGLCAVGAIALVAFGAGAGAFFGAGALLLVTAFLFAYRWLRSLDVRAPELADIGGLAVRNVSRRALRSMTIIMVLASGVFIVVAVDSFRQRVSTGETARRSGTGGFALVGESSLPIYDDLNTAQGRQAFALDEAVMREVRVVPMRVREGDDASCLNLNRALQPRVLGANAAELAQLGAFRGAGGKPVPWNRLEQVEPDGAVPAIVDQATLQWALQKKIGDTIEYPDERGAPFRIRLAATVTGSILQGQLVISERRFLEKYPSHGGYRFFLIDAPVARVPQISAELSRALQDRGLEVVPAWRRLAQLQAVENTYLSIFQVLGGLGLLLGSAGLAVVVARNVLERRREYALMEAVGFRQAQLRKLIFSEHRTLILLGIIAGVVSALIAIWPGFRERAGGFPWQSMGVLLAAILLGSLLWTWLAARIALRGSRIAALRTE